MEFEIIIPCYNEEKVLPLFYREMQAVLSKIEQANFTFLFVDDGSKDKTLEIIKAWAKQNKHVRYLSFSRNFGKESAMLAGLQFSKANYSILMDADLQHPPQLIKEFVQAAEEGYDGAVACQNRKGEAWIKKRLARSFYKLMNLISDVEMIDGVGDFRMLNHTMKEALLSMTEVQRFSKGLMNWLGFRIKKIPFDHVPRKAGKSKWNFKTLYAYAVEGITSFSVFPLRLVTFTGLFVSFCSFLYLFYIVFKTLFQGVDLPGYASTIALILFIGGITILSIGVLGEYISKIYMEVKRRPLYFIKEKSEEDKHD